MSKYPYTKKNGNVVILLRDQEIEFTHQEYYN